jgi:NAD-dependent deacetylase
MTAHKHKSVVVLTGAGVSAESGLQTFRAADGLWEEHRIEDVATPEGFARDAALVQRFYNERRRKLIKVSPNPAHIALAEFEARHIAAGGAFLLVTQNIDDLHERGGSNNLIHMHGELLKARCVSCAAVCGIRGDIAPESACAKCGADLRPHIVWFGEMPLGLERIYAALASADLFVAVGTSGNVYPAAGFVRAAKEAGARCVELNLEESQTAAFFDEKQRGPAGEIVPAFFDAADR